MSERAHDAAIEYQRVSDTVMAQILAELQTVSAKVHEMDGIFRSHVHDEEVNMQETARMMADMQSGFPNNDPKAHCDEHLDGARRMREKADFWRKLNFELAKYGLLGFLGWALWALWQAFLHGPKQ